MENFKINFFEIIQSVPTSKIIFILIRIYVRTSQSHGWEPGYRYINDKTMSNSTE